MKFNPRNQTIRDYVSDDILKEFLDQLPWQKDQLIGIDKTYKDVVKFDQITDATIKIKRGTMSGRFFVEILKQLPRFDFNKHHYQVWNSNFTRETIPPRKYVNKFPGFHVRKILSEIKAAV